MMGFEWSKAEKILARQICDPAVKGEIADIMHACKPQAARITQPEQPWELEATLHAARRDFNNKYDFRYSRLTTLFALLLREGRIADAGLEGLSPDKRELIRRFARDRAGSRRGGRKAVSPAAAERSPRAIGHCLRWTLIRRGRTGIA